MAFRLVEELRGAGDVFQEGVLVGRGSYYVAVNMETGASAQGGKAGRHVNGFVEIDPELTERFANSSTRLMLHLEDGRRLEFVFTTQRGSVLGVGRGLHRPLE